MYWSKYNILLRKVLHLRYEVLGTYVVDVVCIFFTFDYLILLLCPILDRTSIYPCHKHVLHVASPYSGGATGVLWVTTPLQIR